MQTNHFGTLVSFKSYFKKHFGREYCSMVNQHIRQSGINTNEAFSEQDKGDLQVRSEVSDIQLYMRLDQLVYADVIITASSWLKGNCDISINKWANSCKYRVRAILTVSEEDGVKSKVQCIAPFEVELGIPGFPLDDYLVPILSEADLSDVATYLLRKFIPSVLEGPSSVSGETLAAKMGYRVQCLYLDPRFDAVAQLYFSSGQVVTLNMDESNKLVSVGAKTIVVNLTACVHDGSNVDSELISTAVLHECVHGYLHTPFAVFQKITHELPIACLTYVKQAAEAPPIWSGVLTLERHAFYGSTKQTSEEVLAYIETQANFTVPMLRMPEHTFVTKADELISEYEERYPEATRHEVYRYAIQRMAVIFQVSLSSVRKRMLDLGYEAAEGICNPAAGVLVEDYSFAPGAICNYQTFTIGLQDAQQLYIDDPNFRNVLAAGKYKYIDGHFCLRDEKYIDFEDNMLTPYARSHMDECCLVFSCHSNEKHSSFCEGFLQMTQPESFKFSLDKVPDASTVQGKAHMLNTVLNTLPNSPGEALCKLMEFKDITVEQLSSWTGISTKTISRIRSTPGYMPPRGYAKVICAMLGLEPPLRNALLQRWGYILTLSENDTYYDVVTYTYFDAPPSEIAELLCNCSDLDVLSKRVI